MPEITPSILAAADQVDHDLDALDMSTRTLLSLLRAGDTQPPPGGGDTPGSPIIEAQPAGSLTTFNQNHKVGWAFTPSTDLVMTHFRWWHGGAASPRFEVGEVWRHSDTTLLATVNSASPVPNQEWIETELGTPLTLSSGVRYLLATRLDNGTARPVRYANKTGFTLSSLVAYNASHVQNTTGYPAQNDTSTIWGLVDASVREA